jgi:hypothetical protein
MNEDVKAMVEAIDRAVEDGSYDLTDWEEGFLKSIRRLISEGVTISSKQDEVLEKIWSKATR